MQWSGWTRPCQTHTRASATQGHAARGVRSGDMNSHAHALCESRWGRGPLLEDCSLQSNIPGFTSLITHTV
jgi:hypothetical protein